MDKFVLIMKSVKTKSWSEPSIYVIKWILRAACFHIGLVVLINMVGGLVLLPNLFDSYGLGTFASDSKVYFTEAASLADMLTQAGVSEWLSSVCPLHVKLYSISFALFSPLLGSTTLSVEPLNLVYYIAILYLVFNIGKSVIDQRIGLLAAAMIGLWPSFLLHTTQLLEDPLFIIAILMLVSIYISWLNKIHLWRDALSLGALGVMAVLLLWVIRSEMWELTLGIVIVGLTFLFARMVYERRVLAWNLASAGILLVAILMIPKVFPEVRDLDRPIRLPATVEQFVEHTSTDDQSQAISGGVEGSSTSLVKRIVEKLNAVAEQIGVLRDRFIILYPDAGSNLGAEIRISDFDDLVRYFPRAVLTGFFAPFPDMWFVSGARLGLAGRLLSGIETMIVYVIEVLAFLCMWRRRRQLSLWLMLAIATLGMTALSFVVVNIGALYRMRYVFWMLLVILGAGGGMHVISSWQQTRESKAPKPNVSPTENPVRQEIESKSD